jgi:hypothetical protein
MNFLLFVSCWLVEERAKEIGMVFTFEMVVFKTIKSAL